MARSADDVALAFEALTAVPTTSAAPARSLLPEPSSVRRLGVVANFASTPEVKAAFDAVLSTVATMGLEKVEVSVPFESASFDMSRIESDRAAVNASMFGDVGAIILPTLAAPTPTIDAARAQGPLAVSPDNTFFCNYFGLPAITIPHGFDKTRLPLGLQFVGPQGGDAQVIALARAFQRATGWRYSPPQAKS
jgi:aspartyl-tRNA(Asn)/glutamyl-tRNA(Gln) amidotransferase subunit A